jgi:hypothetical protein
MNCARKWKKERKKHVQGNSIQKISEKYNNLTKKINEKCIDF